MEQIYRTSLTDITRSLPSSVQICPWGWVRFVVVWLIGVLTRGNKQEERRKEKGGKRECDAIDHKRYLHSLKLDITLREMGERDDFKQPSVNAMGGGMKGLTARAK